MSRSFTLIAVVVIVVGAGATSPAVGIAAPTSVDTYEIQSKIDMREITNEKVYCNRGHRYGAGRRRRACGGLADDSSALGTCRFRECRLALSQFEIRGIIRLG